MEYSAFSVVSGYDIQTDSFSDPDYAMRYNVRLKVVGVLPARAKVPSLQRYQPSLENIFTNYNPNNPDTEYVYCPKLYVNGKPLQDSLELTDALLFTDTPERIGEYNELLADYGEVWSIEALAQATDEMYADATPEYAVHTILAAAAVRGRGRVQYADAGAAEADAGRVLFLRHAVEARGVCAAGGQRPALSHRRRGRRAVGRVQRKLAAAHDGGLQAVQHSDGRRPCRHTAGRQLRVHHLENAQAHPVALMKKDDAD